MNSSSSEPPDSWNGSPEEYLAGVAMLAELQWQVCSLDPSHFIETFLKTVDAVDRENPDKPFPQVPYLRWLDDFLLTERTVLIPKSRRVLVTWRVAAFCLWACLFQKARNIAYLNEDQDKANQMILMTKQLYESLPQWIKDRAPMKWKTEALSFPASRSNITALEQGPDVGRMHAFSIIWIDEAQDQRHPAAMYQSISATTKGRTLDISGQIFYTGTAKQGWWQLACHDQLTTERPRPPAWKRQLVTDWAPPDIGAPNRDPNRPWGFEVARLTESGHLRIFIHYTADPEKRSVEWHEATHRGVSDEDWDQEYEGNWNAKAGKPAIPHFRLRRHEIVVPAFTPPPHWPRFSSADYGATNPYSWHNHAIDPQTLKGYTYWEYFNIAALGVHLQAIKAHPDFPFLQMRILDGACWDSSQQASDTSLEGMTNHSIKTIAQLHHEAGVLVIPAPRNLRDHMKIALVERVWPKIIPGQPVEQIRWHVMDNCPNLLRECEGQVWSKLSYAQKQKKNDPEQLVDRDNHAFDEWCYMLALRSGVVLDPGQVPPQTTEGAQIALRLEIQKLNDEMHEEEQRQRRDDNWDGDDF